MFVVPGQGAAIDGRAVPVAEAVAAAAALLGRAAAPLIAGLRTDDAGARAAAALARRLDAVLDHAESAAALRDLAAMRGTGWIVATPCWRAPRPIWFSWSATGTRKHGRTSRPGSASTGRRRSPPNRRRGGWNICRRARI